MRADLLVGTADWPPELGGMSEYASGLVGGLEALGAKIRLRVSRRAGRPASRAALLAPTLLADRIASGAPRILALQWSPVGVAAWALKQAFGTPYEVVTYGLDVLEPQRSEKAKAWLERVLCGADRVWAISRFTGDEVRKVGVAPERISLLPPGVEWQRFSKHDGEHADRLRERLGIRQQRVIVTVGRLVRRKGHEQVVRALAQLPEDVAYLIVGDGPERESIEQVAKRSGVGSRVYFAGALSHEDVSAAYELSSLFVLPTREIPGDGDVEGFGIVYLEANAAGLPVVATACGGAVDAVVDQQTGLVVPPGNLDSLVAALRRLLEDGELSRRLATTGMQRARDDFDWKSIANRLLSERASEASPC